MRLRMGGVAFVVACAVETGEHRSAVLGGAATDRPNVAALHYEGTFEGMPVDLVACTATLIAADVLVTAAHCVDPYITDMVGIPTAIFESDATSPAAVRVISSSALVHEAFVYSNPFHIYLESPHDIGLMFLAEPVDGVSPAPLALHSPAPGDPLELVGYGETIANDVSSRGNEQSAQMTVSELGVSEIRELGTGSPQPCVGFGDSGGPVFDSDGAIIGITSHGGGERIDDCAAGVVSERIDVHTDWIVGHAPAVCDVTPAACPDAADDDGGCSSTRGAPTLWCVLLLVAIRRRRGNSRSYGAQADARMRRGRVE